MANPQDTTPAKLPPPGREFMQSMNMPLQVRKFPADQKKGMSEFKIDYQTRRDKRGKDYVCKVYLPSPHKGWVIMAERTNAVSPRAKELRPEISKVMTEFKVDYQIRRDSTGEDTVYKVYLSSPHNGRIIMAERKDAVSPWPKELRPVTSRKAEKQMREDLNYVQSNGNSQAYYWDRALNDERQIGKEIACNRAGEGAQVSATSTSDTNSDHGSRASSYELSESNSDGESSNSRSQVMTPSLCHDHSHETRASPKSRTQLDHGNGNGVSQLWDKEVDVWDLESPQSSVTVRAEAPSKIAQSQPSEQLRDLRARTFPLSHETNTRTWTWTTPETPEQYESKTDTVEASANDSIHSDFDAVHATPKTAAPTSTSQGHVAIGNAYGIPTPLTATDFSADRLPKHSPVHPIPSLTSPINNANRPELRELLPPPLPGATKRHITSEPSPLAQSPKRQRILLPEPRNLPQAKTTVKPSRHFENQGPQLLPMSPGGPALSLSENGPTSGEKMDVDRVSVRQSKGAGLRINTQAAESATPLRPKNEPTRGEKLYADYVKNHEEFRRELENLNRELCAANKRADMAELRAAQAQEAANKGYQANFANFKRLKELEESYKADVQSKERRNRMLERKFDEQTRELSTLRIRCATLKEAVDEPK